MTRADEKRKAETTTNFANNCTEPFARAETYDLGQWAEWEMIFFPQGEIPRMERFWSRMRIVTRQMYSRAGLRHVAWSCGSV